MKIVNDIEIKISKKNNDYFLTVGYQLLDWLYKHYLSIFFNMTDKSSVIDCSFLRISA